MNSATSTSADAAPLGPRTIERALESQGSSNSDALLTVVRSLVERCGTDSVVVDVGCGTGRLHTVLRGCFSRYLGVDVVRYGAFPDAPDAEFVQLDLDDAHTPLASAVADVVCCVETIEHLENPRALARELDRIVRPGGLVVVTTPNQLSLVSKLCLLTRGEFVHFQERPGLYPAHLTALLESDLRRIAREIGWRDVQVHYSGDGRMPGTATHWPRALAATSGWRGRAFSDNVILSGVKPQ